MICEKEYNSLHGWNPKNRVVDFINELIEKVNDLDKRIVELEEKINTK